MRLISILVVLSLMMSVLCGCFAYEGTYVDTNDPDLAENYLELIPGQKQEMTNLYYEYKTVLNDIKDMIYADANISGISSEGYIIFRDGNKKWVEDISPRIKDIYELKGMGYKSFGLYGGRNTKGETFLYIETYYSTTMMMYRIEYSATDLTKKDEWYTKLEDNWYFWAAGMT